MPAKFYADRFICTKKFYDAQSQSIEGNEASLVGKMERVCNKVMELNGCKADNGYGSLEFQVSSRLSVNFQ